MSDPDRQTRSHEQHRVLSIRGKSYCNSACAFCIEKFSTYHPVSPRVDETRALIEDGAGKFNMLFFMNGEPSIHPKLLEYVRFAKEKGFRYFGMSSHFRAFADPYLALAVLEAGFEFFDISLHASTFEGQLEINPIDDGGRSLKEALHGLRNIFEIARRTRRQVGVTHKVVITRLNYRELLPLFRATYDLGVRNYIFQPVKVSGLRPEVQAKLGINEDEFMPEVNELLRRTEGMGAEIKLYGMSQLGAYASQDLVQESNLIKHAVSRRNREPTLDLYDGDRLVPETLALSEAPAHKVTVRLPDGSQSATFVCHEDQVLLNAALAGGLGLPFGCRMGSCGMCAGKLVEGAVERLPQQVLSEQQVAEGFTLLCRSRPRADCVIVTHQEHDLGL